MLIDGRTIEEEVARQEEELDQINVLLNQKKSEDLTSYTPLVAKKEISTEIDDRARELENKAFEQDIKLKKISLFTLFFFLAFETVAIFAFAYFQAVGFNGFKLEQWSFNLLVSATIAQITYMVQMTVKHLFP